VLAVDAIDLCVGTGEVYGFLGRNGAGKTTTIRALLGMVRPSAGRVSLFGQPIGPGGCGPWRRVGHLVETPVAYPELTVRENLEVARRLHGVADASATIRAIDRFGLGAAPSDGPARCRWATCSGSASLGCCSTNLNWSCLTNPLTVWIRLVWSRYTSS
jgi:ABC-type multidrug transport system ATPase subunit